jgi:hypothetical protein
MKVLSWSLPAVIGFLIADPSKSAVETGDARIREEASDALTPFLEDGDVDRRLAPCPEVEDCFFGSQPFVTVCTEDNFLSSYCEDANPPYYPVPPNDDGGVCFFFSDRAVLVLTGLQNCLASIRSVTFNLTKVGQPGYVRYFVEKGYPYTVFGDTPTKVYTRPLSPGSYKLRVTIKQKETGCDIFSLPFDFLVSEICDV